MGETIDARRSYSMSIINRHEDGKVITLDVEEVAFDLKRDGSIEINILDNFWQGYRKSITNMFGGHKNNSVH